MASPKLLADLTTLKPEPRGAIRWGDPPVDYPVVALQDLKYDAMIELLLTAEQAAAGLPLRELAGKIRAQVLVLVPTAPVAQMTYAEMLAFLRAAHGGDASAETNGGPPGAADPPPAAAEASSTGSPPPPAPSAGPTTT